MIEINPLKAFFIPVLFFLAISFAGQAQKKSGDAVRITYRQIVNGNEVRQGSGTILVAGKDISEARNDRSGVPQGLQMANEREMTNYRTNTAYQLAVMQNNKGDAFERFHIKSPFSTFPELTYTGEREIILGYSCEKATSTLRSNHIEIWFTQDLPYRGTPQMAYGIPDGLVLKLVRNQNYGFLADTLVFLDAQEAPRLPEDPGREVDQALYRHLITENLITTIDIFQDEQISWGNEINNPPGIETNHTYKYAGGTVILKKITLPEASEGDLLFAELLQYSNGDAYDRTGTVFMIPEWEKSSFLDALRDGIEKVPAFTAHNGKRYQGMTAMEGYLPAVELLRFFTPFGVRHFNDQVQVYGQEWEKAAWFKQEVTDLKPLLKGEVWIGVYIGNYDRGGHKVSLRLKYYPGSPRSRESKVSEQWMMPLFNTLNIMEMAGQEYGTLFDKDTLTVEFNLPEGVKNLKLRFLTTGHGGWGGGDEFNQKENRIFIDDRLVLSYTPWRTDCGTWRKYNPSSGNFWNGVTSSDYSRSGWCPGSATDPVFVPIGNHAPGNHTLKVAIPQGEPEGNSFSSWCISGILTGEF